jgi:hypothetical protein
MTNNLYHYTCGHKLPGIQADSLLRRSKVPPFAPREKGILWLSANPIYEPSACKPLLTPEGRRVLDVSVLRAKVGLYRFTLVEGMLTPAVLPWPGIGLRAGMSEDHRKAVSNAGMAMGGVPTQWWGTIIDIPTEVLCLDWLNDEGQWQPVTLAEGVARFRSQGYAVASYSDHDKAVTGVAL